MLNDKIAALMSADRFVTIVLSALMPPAEEPITIMSWPIILFMKESLHLSKPQAHDYPSCGCKCDDHAFIASESDPIACDFIYPVELS